MAVTATFRTTAGTKTWEVSPRKILDIDGLSTGFELEADNNSAVEGSPLTNERGLKKKQISFSSNFHAALGFDVRAEFDSWETWVGLAGILRFGGERFGANSWLLTSAKATNIQTDPSGRWRSFKMAFTFEESDDRRRHRRSGSGNRSGKVGGRRSTARGVCNRQESAEPVPC